MEERCVLKKDVCMEDSKMCLWKKDVCSVDF